LSKKKSGGIRYEITRAPRPSELGPVLDMACCCSCGWTAKASEFIEETEQDGPEGPRYIIHDCPKCEDGFVEDYHASEESYAEWEKDCAEEEKLRTKKEA
jgi:hypothetical protein